MSEALALDHPVVGIRLWQTLTMHNIPQYAPMSCRWQWARYKPGRLYGLMHQAPEKREWHPGVNEARCAAYDMMAEWYVHHIAPQPKCTCGLYAYHDLDALRRIQCKTDGEVEIKEPFVCGLIRGWGIVYCHPNGWRAQKAEILALFGDWGQSKRMLMQVIADYYRVPLLTKNGLPEIMSEFGDPIPVEMRPQPK